jgi:hypothetical protein
MSSPEYRFAFPTGPASSTGVAFSTGVASPTEA